MTGHRVALEGYLEYLNTQILGNRENNELMFAACINPHPTNVIIIGSPGTSKTTSVNIIARLLGQPFAKVQATPNLDINKVLGPIDLKKLIVDKAEIIRWSEWTEAYFKFIDEFNRLTPESAVSLMEILDTSRGKRSLHINQHEAPTLPPGPLFATMNNPDSGTNDVFPPMLDRFDMCIVMKHPHAHDLLRIGSGELSRFNSPPQMTRQQFESLKKEVDRVKVPKEMLRYVSMAVRDLSFCQFGEMETKTAAAAEHCGRSCRFCPKIDHRSPASPRVLLSIVSMGKALAYLRGKDEVGFDEVRSLVAAAIRHRVRLNMAYLNKFNNINDAYSDLFSELKALWVQREGIDVELKKASDLAAAGDVLGAKPHLEKVINYAKSDGVYSEMVHHDIAALRKKGVPA
ncbi:MAG: MoxR family ATPase [Candidatus Micrarchaeia archaeon]